MNLNKVETWLNEKIERLESDLTEFVSSLKSKDIRIESKLKAIENTMRIKSTSRSKYSRRRTVSTKHRRRVNSFAYPSVKPDKRKNTSSIKHRLSKELYKKTKGKAIKRVQRSIPKAKQKISYSHDDYENSELCNESSPIDQQNARTFIDESTPKTNQFDLANYLEVHAWSDHKSGSIKLATNEELSDWRTSRAMNNVNEIIDKGSLNYINKKCFEIKQTEYSDPKDCKQLLYLNLSIWFLIASITKLF